jgi:hypothetical protein
MVLIGAMVMLAEIMTGGALVHAQAPLFIVINTP